MNMRVASEKSSKRAAGKDAKEMETKEHLDELEEQVKNLRESLDSSKSFNHRYNRIMTFVLSLNLFLQILILVFRL